MDLNELYPQIVSNRKRNGLMEIGVAPFEIGLNLSK